MLRPLRILIDLSHSKVPDMSLDSTVYVNKDFTSFPHNIPCSIRMRTQRL